MNKLVTQIKTLFLLEKSAEMEIVMREIVEVLKKRINEKKNSMLITVVAGRGSIPRKAGAYMVVGEDGRVTGTIGGGNLEYQATLMGQKLLAEKKNQQNLEWYAVEMRPSYFTMWTRWKMLYGSDRWKRQKKKENHSGSLCR